MGAGAVLGALHDLGEFEASPEAEIVRAAWPSRDTVPDLIRRCASGVELARGGFGADVEIAVELDSSTVVPVLADGAFRPR